MRKKEMSLKEGLTNLIPYIKKPFGDILPEEELNKMQKNKGRAGQVVEQLIGLSNDSQELDFTDGELKTIKRKDNEKISGTLAITSISSAGIDTLLGGQRYSDSHVGHKLGNMLLVFINKTGSPKDWKLSNPVLVSQSDKRFQSFYQKIEEDYEDIMERANEMIKQNKKLHTISGRNNFLQIRTKDSRPYHPIYSRMYDCEVSNKGRAFFLRSAALRYIDEVLSA